MLNSTNQISNARNCAERIGEIQGGKQHGQKSEQSLPILKVLDEMDVQLSGQKQNKKNAGDDQRHERS
jgi:hypothetical protein